MAGKTDKKPVSLEDSQLDDFSSGRCPLSFSAATYQNPHGLHSVYNTGSSI